MILSIDTSLVIAVVVIILLIGLFFITYIYNKKTPIPDGCEDITREAHMCSGCNNKSCQFHEEVAEDK